MRRIKSLECEFTGEPCYNPRCKVGHCIEERNYLLRSEAADRRNDPAELKDREVATVAKQVAKEWIRGRGRVATPEQIAKAMNNTWVLKETKRRVDYFRTISENLEDLKSEDLLKPFLD